MIMMIMMAAKDDNDVERNGNDLNSSTLAFRLVTSCDRTFCPVEREAVSPILVSM